VRKQEESSQGKRTAMAFPSDRALLENLITDPYIGFLFRCYSDPVSGSLVGAKAQTVPALDSIKGQEELTRAIGLLDTRLFDAYNKCEIDTLSAMVAEDLEFYHDKTGLAVGRQNFTDSIKKKYAGR
jgi:hypothetical protein